MLPCTKERILNAPNLLKTIRVTFSNWRIETDIINIQRSPSWEGLSPRHRGSSHVASGFRWGKETRILSIGLPSMNSSRGEHPTRMWTEEDASKVNFTSVFFDKV